MKRLLTVFAIGAAMFAGPALADLTPAQRTTLRTDILADPVLSQLPASSDAVNQIVAAYAAQPVVSCTVWRSVLTPAMARAAIIKGGSQVDALTGSKRDTLFYLVSGDLAPSDPDVRADLDDVAGSQATLKAALQAAQKRLSNRLEKLFSAGSCTALSPSTMAVEGALTYQDVLTVMGW